MSEQVLAVQTPVEEQAQPQATSGNRPYFRFQRKHYLFLGGILLLLIITTILLAQRALSAPILSLQPPTSVGVASHEEFTVDLVLSAMDDHLYPAASIIVDFDKNRLEFTGVKMGNVMVYENYNPIGDSEAASPTMMIPTWSCNTELSNQTGEIRAMYLDMTGGNNAYGTAGFDVKSQNVVLRLGFKLKDSVSAGDKIQMSLVDAVFATSGGDVDGTSMSTSKDLNTLRAKDAEILVKQVCGIDEK